MPPKKKIALFSNYLSFGGTERVVSLLCNELTKYYNVSLIIIYNNIEFPIHKDVNIIVLTNENFNQKQSLLSKVFLFFKVLFRYRKALEKNNIETSISFLVLPNLINSCAKILNGKLKTIISERCFPSKMYSSIKFSMRSFKFIVKSFYNKNDLLFSNSVYINEDLIQNFGLKIYTKVVYNPIQLAQQRKDLSSYDKPSQEFKVISIGRLIEEKNHKGTIESIDLLPSNYTLEIFGNGSLENELKLTSANLKLEERIHFKGSVNNVLDYLVKGHCLVLFSNTEGFPNAILEAMSVGLPVISSNCMSGPLELLNENQSVSIETGSFFKAKYGILVNVNDIQGLSKAIQFLQKNNDIRLHYSEKGLERVKEFEVSKIGLEMNNLINKINI
ncbi:glycosyltransferase [Yeosuana sp. MJ-SS3]|uniref:Glycosyltransferase n=1 Tax=Gilvirhabdus luticola TaxID=3079858 RepID=A0ABU3U6W7_9FLAO|nr:glycosyltransferase [Yeosuana sp. MJ-SS3]MDU8886147.1 glycosyltransferase [Yeosuana sp. MJ-SS3]